MYMSQQICISHFCQFHTSLVCHKKGVVTCSHNYRAINACGFIRLHWLMTRNKECDNRETMELHNNTVILSSVVCICDVG